ncbi:MAG: ChaN family lipoprotein [Bacteroidales bacterium]|nr:ChaN family lipoprotein [Bacteroidales bacterium]
MKALIYLIILTFPLAASAQDKPAYRIFNSEGKPVTYADMIRSASGADIVFFGELHDDPVAHWLELEVSKSLFDLKKGNIVLGAEMFEADNQLLLDEYLKGVYDAARFEAEAKLWNNYKTDYRPLVEYAKTTGLPFIATNVPRRYANVVNRKGFEGLDSLTAEAKKYIAPLPVFYDPELKCYKDMLKMEGMGSSMAHTTANLPKAQALKDATMAHFILKNLVKDKIFIHFNGSYHSSNFEGIVWYLLKANPSLKITTIETVRQKDISEPEKGNLKKASFIIIIPESMTRTY